MWERLTDNSWLIAQHSK